MIQITKNLIKAPISTELIQLRHIKGESVYLTDPEGNKIEIKTTSDGTKIVFSKDEEGRCIAIEERLNGTKVYHISSDSTGLPSSHEIRTDQTEIVYFYNSLGNLQHFVELKTNGDRVSTILGKDGSIYSIEQKQVGGISFYASLRKDNEPKEGMVWLHQNGEISTYGNKEAINEIIARFPKHFDGVKV